MRTNVYDTRSLAETFLNPHTPPINRARSNGNIKLVLRAPACAGCAVPIAPTRSTPPVCAGHNSLHVCVCVLCNCASLRARPFQSNRRMRCRPERARASSADLGIYINANTFIFAAVCASLLASWRSLQPKQRIRTRIASRLLSYYQFLISLLQARARVQSSLAVSRQSVEHRSACAGYARLCVNLLSSHDRRPATGDGGSL